LRIWGLADLTVDFFGKNVLRFKKYILIIMIIIIIIIIITIIITITIIILLIIIIITIIRKETGKNFRIFR